MMQISHETKLKISEHAEKCIGLLVNCSTIRQFMYIKARCKRLSFFGGKRTGNHLR